MNQNYQKTLDNILENIKQEGNSPRLLLHSCCAPCSTHVLLYLTDFFEITIFFYNPNIYPESEYQKRAKEQVRLLNELPTKNKINFIQEEYHPDEFYSSIKGLENESEGGLRCFKCYDLRLEKTAITAKNLDFGYFTTTLSISPFKNAFKLNEIGNKLADMYGVKFLPSDFKKKEGYKNSITLSRKYDLYRQEYCGCIFSKKESELKSKINIQND